MKLHQDVLLLVVFSVLVVKAQAQNDYETFFNYKTGNIETRYNPWNEENQRYQRAEADRQLNDMVMRHRYEQQDRDRQYFEEQSQQRTKDLRDLSWRLLQQATLRQRQGAALIKAGKATTSFKPTPKFSLKGYLFTKTKSAEVKQKIEQFAEISFKQFQGEMRVQGLTVNDLADGQALAFILGHEIFFGQKPGNVHLQWLRRNGKKGLLQNSYFQGGSNQERQQLYGMYGALIIYAKNIYDKRNSASQSDQEDAKGVAREILELVWENSTDTILMTTTGFMHKGNKIIADGKNTYDYTYNPDLRSSERFAQKQNSPKLAIDYQNNLNLFYQELARRGGQKNDMVWAGTLSAYGAYFVLTDGKELNDNQIKSIYEFIKTSILASLNIQAASNENRQLACEILAIQSTGLYRRFLNDRQNGTPNYNKEGAKAILQRIFKALNKDPNKYELTATGISPATKKGT